MSVQTSAGILPETDAELVRRGDAMLADLARLILELRHQVYEVSLPADPEGVMRYVQHHAATMVELGHALDRYAAWVAAFRRTVLEPVAQLGTAGPGGQLA